MIRTIFVSTYISVQGEFVRNCRNGQIIVRSGTAEFRGWPVSRAI